MVILWLGIGGLLALASLLLWLLGRVARRQRLRPRAWQGLLLLMWAVIFLGWRLTHWWLLAAYDPNFLIVEGWELRLPLIWLALTLLAWLLLMVALRQRGQQAQQQAQIDEIGREDRSKNG